LLVDGPASVEVVSGKVEVFANTLKEAQRVLVRDGKSLPLYATESSVLEFFLGAMAAVK
jgi:hypothetical protein